LFESVYALSSLCVSVCDNDTSSFIVQLRDVCSYAVGVITEGDGDGWGASLVVAPFERSAAATAKDAQIFSATARFIIASTMPAV